MDFDARIQRERQVQSAAAEAEARRHAELQRREEEAATEMARLAAGLARRADQIGWEPEVAVLCEHREVMVEEGLFTRRKTRAHCYLETLGQGWVVEDRNSLNEYGHAYTRFFVFRGEERWIDLGIMGTHYTREKGKDIPGIPQDLKRQQLLVVSPNGANPIQWVHSSALVGGAAESVLIQTLIREEDKRNGTTGR